LTPEKFVMINNRLLNPEKWIENYSDALYTFTLQRVNSTTQAEDIVQEIFLSAWRARDTYNGTASEKNWLYTICKNKIIDYYRKASTHKEVLAGNDENDDLFFGDDGHFKENTKAQEWNIDSSNTIDTKEFYSILSKCKSKLKAIQQSVFSMKYLEDIETNDICETLGITTQNYWVLMHRAKLQIRACLEKNWINL
jgi:RNA polymerase sigma-70 factor (ECF subfamily)